MVIGVPTESSADEKRVAIVPGVLPLLTKAGVKVVVERGAGETAGFSDAMYLEQGASLASDRSRLLSMAEIFVQVHGLDLDTRRTDRNLPGQDQILIGLLNPLGASKAVGELAARGVTSFALELLPRISRAQSMDALTSMASISGYKAVLMAAGLLGKMFPMMITAAGTITPSRVFVIGAGVAGLQSIATAHRLGAVVQAYDVRPAVKEQVESLGAKFVELELERKGAEAASGYAADMGEDFYRRQRELLTRVVAESDVVITTAAIPGKKAPVLVTSEAVEGMRRGGVIIDLASETGGNCQLTQPGGTVDVRGVTVIGPLNLSSTVPYHASQMYARNVTAFLLNLLKNGELALNLEDQIIRDTLLTHKGEVANPVVRQSLGLPALTTSIGELKRPDA
ncbi:MAG TPA: Re/Si-specific NAD(P)(+) transhydrogenase subunit alpha [Bacteroidota bacterium]|nr:Re/Si-specific NAD(P)(+) transhydrogenase subunit alpha [Bacteroidota bacterium]